MNEVQPQTHNQEQTFNQRLATSGFRLTPQRQHVYGVLMHQLDHPTAEEVFIRAKERMPEISMATVYNCLDALVKSGLVRQVNLDRAATRYCPNMREHSHFYCNRCGSVFDVDLRREGGEPQFILPDGFQLKHSEISLRGLCGSCGQETDDSPTRR